MKIIDYNLEERIPPLQESDIYNSIILGITYIHGDYSRGYAYCIAIAIATQGAIKWFGGNELNSSRGLHLFPHPANSLIDLLIEDYKRCGPNTKYIIIESMDDFREVWNLLPTVYNADILGILDHIANILWK